MKILEPASLQSLKRGFACIAFLLLYFSNTAQTAKGDKLLEGTLGNFMFSGNNYLATRDNSRLVFSYRTTGLSLAPRAGYFLTENLVLGLAPVITYTGTTRVDKMPNGHVSYRRKEATLEVNCEAFLRFYFRNFNVKNRLYIQPGLGIGFAPYKNNQEIFYNAGDDGVWAKNTAKYLNPTNQVFGQLLIGYNYFFNQRVALNVCAGYSYFKRQVSYREDRYESAIPYNQPGTRIKMETISYSLMWNLGLTFFFIKEKKA